jgi:AraC family transcriptional regulator of adaptative response/methylated-DNA-[protein]-cysteine methyltransferase
VVFGIKIIYHEIAKLKNGDRSMDFIRAAEDYYRIEKALQYIENHFERQPELKEIAEAACLSEYHFQRVFSRWVGISPKRFLQFLTKEHAKKLLRQSRNLLDTTYETGLTSPGRLHDLFVACEAVTPGEFKNKGAGLIIRYGVHPTPFGSCLLALTDRGICNLSFIIDGDTERSVRWLKRKWRNAILNEDLQGPAETVSRIFEPGNRVNHKPLHLLLKGTNFQIKVWEALMRIPLGYVMSYEDVATMIGKPEAVRAVANAVANNPISYIIPCHRVIRKMGIIHQYQWGSARKKAILGWEAAKRLQIAP